MSARNQKNEPIKNQLAYSELSDTVYWIDSKGQKQDVSQQFMTMIETWATGGNLRSCNRSFSYSKATVEIQVRLTTPSQQEVGTETK
jgi:hypothetical protein